MSMVSVDDILGLPTTPQSLDDFSVSSPSSFMSSRHASPCSFISAEPFPSPPPSQEEAKEVKPEPEQKPVKKRKSWGQKLPTPTTNLPPRKRAKTAEEKEQRRVERVLRNRAAAQKSREIKKQQLEAIETERDQLKYKFEALSQANAKLAASNTHLLAQLKRLEEENARLRQQQQPPQAVTVEETLDSLFLNCYGVDPFSTVTCDEASLSTTSPCMTHQPAELMCFDLPCLPGTTATTTMSMTSLPLTTLVMSLACFILTLITSLITTPLWRFLPQSRFRNPPNQSWRSFSTAIWFAARRKMSLACCYVLAHLRIATDGNTQQITSDGGRYHVAERALRSVFGEGDEVDAVTGRNWLDIGRDWRSHSRGGARTHSFNWAIMR